MVQHFIRETTSPTFRSETQPKLYYLGNITPQISSYPRILHSHAEHVEISIIYSGQSEYLIRDKKQLIRPGDILIYNSQIVHDELSDQNNQIGSYFFAVGEIQVPGLRPNALIPDEANPVFHVQSDFDRILQFCQEMLRDATYPDKWSECMTVFRTQTLLEIIWRVIHAEQPAEPVQSQYIEGQNIKTYIDRHFCEPLTLRTISEALGLSESYVSHAFKNMLGYSPMQYVLRRKIGEAQTLLISTDYSITRIAQMVGYDSQSHFNQRFSRYVGISPSRFRKNYQNDMRRNGDSENQR
jgi:AraC-like DNA-binding protein